MSIPENYRGVFEPGSETVPFWTMAASALRGRFAGRPAGVAHMLHRAGGSDYMRVSVECPVAGSFRMTEKGLVPGLVPSLPLSSLNKDLPVGDEELDAAYAFWSDDPDRMVLLVHQPGVKEALRQAATVAGRGFCYATIRGGEADVVFNLRGTTCGPDRIRALLAALATVAAAAEKTWSVDRRNWAFWRFWNGGGAYVVLVGAAAVVLGLIWLFVVGLT
jgi:hypothetical protein